MYLQSIKNNHKKLGFGEGLRNTVLAGTIFLTGANLQSCKDSTIQNPEITESQPQENKTPQNNRICNSSVNENQNESTTLEELRNAELIFFELIKIDNPDLNCVNLIENEERKTIIRLGFLGTNTKVPNLNNLNLLEFKIETESSFNKTYTQNGNFYVEFEIIEIIDTNKITT